MNEYILSAFIFGLTAGFKPGPLGIIVIQQTLQYGLRYGIKASLAPIITDGPIILAALLLFSQFKDISLFIALLCLIGGVYLIWLSIKIMRIEKIDYSKSMNSNNSLVTAIKINLLSPNPYLFWFAVGGSYIIRGNTLESSVFIGVAIGTLVLSKMAIAWLAFSYREMLDSSQYLVVMKILGGLLTIFGLLLLKESYFLLFLK